MKLLNLGSVHTNPNEVPSKKNDQAYFSKFIEASKNSGRSRKAYLRKCIERKTDAIHLAHHKYPNGLNASKQKSSSTEIAQIEHEVLVVFFNMWLHILKGLPIFPKAIDELIHHIETLLQNGHIDIGRRHSSAQTRKNLIDGIDAA